MSWQRARIRLMRSLGTGAAFGLANRVREFLFLARARARQSYSQGVEDRFLLDYFGAESRGFYMDVGANHPFVISNTYLLYLRGWRGITAEPVRYLWQRHRELRPRDTSVNVGVGDRPGTLTFHQMVPASLSTFDAERAARLVAEGCQARAPLEIEVLTLAELFRRHGGGTAVDLLSVDVEGWDLKVLEGNDWELLRPRMVLCEVLPATEAPIDELLRRQGYVLLREFGGNRVYEHPDPRPGRVP